MSQWIPLTERAGNLAGAAGGAFTIVTAIVEGHRRLRRAATCLSREDDQQDSE
ncbi:hypothetical protein [Streptomyces sp. YS-3]|uniref:hypothetical protein n=1 Tax=Streptomyces sp. YS-3 TaxID=3381352 RepID=UPI0038628551